MSPFLRRGKDDFTRNITALDIGTELIKALVVRREGERDEESGVVLGVGREPQRVSAMSGGAVADLEAVIDAANAAMEAAEDMAGVVPGQAVVGVAGELVKGFSSSIAYPRDRPQAGVKQSELRNLLQLVQKRALREAQHQLELERGYGAELEARLVHSAITSVRMDGYPISNPIGFQGRNLEITVFNTFCPMTHIGALETVVRELDLELTASVAQPYAVALACAGEEVMESGAIFVDVGGGTTDVALVRDGGVEGTRMFNLGGRAFTRRLAQTLGVSMDEAEARKLRHSEGLLPAEEDSRVGALIGADVEVLLQGLYLCLKELARGEVLPNSIFLCGGGSLLPELPAELGRATWASGLPFSRAPVARRLKPGDVHRLFDSTGQLTSPQDVGPMGLADHALRAGSEDATVLSTVMRGVLKSMRVS
ncbi:MAG: cell division FtsA domain-containing protein [Candidatus Dormibacteraceae bacterium]